jgi:uncharacterized peroxidase-related enzyme
MARIPLPEPGPPGLPGLLAFRPTTGAALSEFMEHLLRAPGPLPPAWREAIGAYVSGRNGCEYCSRVHTATACAVAGDDELRAAAAEGPSAPGTDPRLAALLDLAGAVADGGRAVSDELVAAARAAGCDDVAVHDAVLIAAAFCMVNRYVDGLGARTPTEPEFYRRAGTRLAEHGYRMG